MPSIVFRFLRANVIFKDGTAYASLTGKQNPGVMKTIMGCNALIGIMPAGFIKKGDKAKFILLDI